MAGPIQYIERPRGSGQMRTVHDVLKLKGVNKDFKKESADKAPKVVKTEPKEEKDITNLGLEDLKKEARKLGIKGTHLFKKTDKLIEKIEEFKSAKIEINS